jgi:succinyl-diaminopimelate desuccinylase
MKLDSIELLETLVSFDTRNDGNTKPEKKCPEFINGILENCGFHTEILESNGYFTTFARRGHGTFKILFLAHFDVVPFGDDWASDPLKLRIEGDRAYGRGTCDDKGNVVSLLLLAEKIAESDYPCTVMIAASGDEELGGRQGAGHLKEYLLKQGLFPDYVVIADGSGQNIIHRRRNILPTFIKVKERKKKIQGTKETVRVTTETYGTDTRHSAYLRFGVDRHAMIAASKYLDLNPRAVVESVNGAFLKGNVVPDWVEMEIIHPNESGPDYTYDSALTDLMRSLLPITRVAFPTHPSDMGTNICPNILSKENDLWTLYIDIRSMTNDDEAVKLAIESALKDRVSLFSLQVHPGMGYVDCDPDSHLIKAAKWALEKEKIPYRIIEGFGASDSRFFAGEGADLFDFGPIGDNVHGVNEWVSLESLRTTSEVYHTLIDVLLRKPGSL